MPDWTVIERCPQCGAGNPRDASVCVRCLCQLPQTSTFTFKQKLLGTALWVGIAIVLIPVGAVLVVALVLGAAYGLVRASVVGMRCTKCGKIHAMRPTGRRRSGRDWIVPVDYVQRMYRCRFCGHADWHHESTIPGKADFPLELVLQFPRADPDALPSLEDKLIAALGREHVVLGHEIDGEMASIMISTYTPQQAFSECVKTLKSANSLPNIPAAWRWEYEDSEWMVLWPEGAEPDPYGNMFRGNLRELLELVDEARQKRSTAQSTLDSNGNRVFDVDMGRAIGTFDEQRIQIITREGKSNIISASPIS